MGEGERGKMVDETRGCEQYGANMSRRTGVIPEQSTKLMHVPQSCNFC